ncbi:MAG TPA: hypothetical protein VGE34_00340 [Candidatus Saccharimonadales bacterium]
MIEQLGPEVETFTQLVAVDKYLRELFPDNEFPSITPELLAKTGLLSRVIGRNIVTVGMDDELFRVSLTATHDDDQYESI